MHAAPELGRQPGLLGALRAGVTAAPSGDMRRPFFVAAIVVSAIVVLVELTLARLVGGGQAGTATVPDAPESSLSAVETPGSGIPYLALVDGLLLFTLVLLGLGLVVSHRLLGRIQGVVTLVVCLLWILGGLLLALLAVAQLLLMVGLFVAVPFGTLAYLAIWGFFPADDAAVVLGLLLTLKIALAVLLLLAQQRFLSVRGLVVLVAVSFGLQLVLGLLHSVLPGPVVAIGDQLWAVVTAVVAIIWALIMLIAAIPAIINAIRVSAGV